MSASRSTTSYRSPSGTCLRAERTSPLRMAPHPRNARGSTESSPFGRCASSRGGVKRRSAQRGFCAAPDTWSSDGGTDVPTAAQSTDAQRVPQGGHGDRRCRNRDVPRRLSGAGGGRNGGAGRRGRWLALRPAGRLEDISLSFLSTGSGCHVAAPDASASNNHAQNFPALRLLAMELSQFASSQPLAKNKKLRPNGHRRRERLFGFASLEWLFRCSWCPWRRFQWSRSLA